MASKDTRKDPRDFYEVLGLVEEPMGMYYTGEQPQEGISPKAGALPDAEAEAAGQVDWGSIAANFACVLGVLWRARKKPQRRASRRMSLPAVRWSRRVTETSRCSTRSSGCKTATPRCR